MQRTMSFKLIKIRQILKLWIFRVLDNLWAKYFIKYVSFEFTIYRSWRAKYVVKVITNKYIHTHYRYIIIYI